MSISNRTDTYLVKPKIDTHTNSKILIRYIPEFSFNWRQPRFSISKKQWKIKVEPLVSLIFGRKLLKSDEKFIYSNNHLFVLNSANYNKFSGIDYHEFGSRFNYGLNYSLAKNATAIHIFFGQGIREKNKYEPYSHEYIGKLKYFHEQLSIEYNFRKSHRLKTISDALNVNIDNKRYFFNGNITTLHNLFKYYYIDNYYQKQNRLRQLNINFGLYLNNNIHLSGESIIDASHNHKFKQILRSIKMTYEKDCVSITGKIFDDFTQDVANSVNKNHSISFSVGLQIINM